ncbi:MAG TPA: hypothetical protein VJM50_23945 [Pyrinomonadaceae bacterium]|nr:hypothetical protein [Pyrinomonadaceae bacterium]
MSSPAYLTPAQLQARWENAVTTGTLSNWRSQGRGPSFVKFGRSVRYPIQAVIDYEAANHHGQPANDNTKPP